MAFEPKSKTIDGVAFKVVPFPAIEALRLKAYLIKLVGPALGRLLGSLSGGKGLSDSKVDGAELSAALESFLSQLGEDEFEALVRRILKFTSCVVSPSGGDKIAVSFDTDFENKMNLVFQGKLFTIYPLILFVLEVNYPDFFAKVGDIGLRFRTLLSKTENADVTTSSTE